ncbi:MAG: hypothetical protein ACI8RA_001031 [Chlamydiales bacterium]|jgi:hypothetical protein
MPSVKFARLIPYESFVKTLEKTFALTLEEIASSLQTRETTLFLQTEKTKVLTGYLHIYTI